jgi:hypothetical protein
MEREKSTTKCARWELEIPIECGEREVSRSFRGLGQVQQLCHKAQTCLAVFSQVKPFAN